MAGKKVVRGRAFQVENSNRKFGADPSYLNVWVQLPGKTKDYALLFTEEEIARAKARGKANLEDILEKSEYHEPGTFEEGPGPITQEETGEKKDGPIDDNSAAGDTV